MIGVLGKQWVQSSSQLTTLVRVEVFFFFLIFNWKSPNFSIYLCLLQFPE